MARRRGIIQKLPRSHVITNANPETLTGDCSDCGPKVALLALKGSMRCREIHNQGRRAYYARNVERKRAYQREYQRAYRFGWTVAELDEVLSAPRCEICDKELDRRQARLDHDHAHCPPGKGCAECFRGILCNACNAAVGLLKEDPAVFARALAYLERTSVASRSA